MKKIFKKSIAILLSSAIFISGMSISALAAETNDGIIDTEAEFIEAIEAGDDIDLAGDIVLTQTITVPAESSTVINGYNYTITVSDEFTYETVGWSDTVFNLENGAELTVKNLTFQDFANDSVQVVFFISSDATDAQLTLENVIFDNSDEPVNYDNYHYCVEAYAGTITATNCTFDLVPGDGISNGKYYNRGLFLMGSSYATVSGCTFSGEATATYITIGIDCDASTSAVQDDEGNWIYFAEGFVVSDCTFTDCDYGIAITGNASDSTAQVVKNSTFTNSELQVFCMWEDWYAYLRIEDSINLEGTSSITVKGDYAEVIIGPGTYDFDPSDYTIEDTNLVSDNGDGTYTVYRNEEAYLDIIEELLATTSLVINEETANTSEEVNDLLVELVEELILENTDYDGDILVQSVAISTTNFVAADNGVDGSFDYNVAVGLGTGVVAVRNISGTGVVIAEANAEAYDNLMAAYDGMFDYVEDIATFEYNIQDANTIAEILDLLEADIKAYTDTLSVETIYGYADEDLDAYLENEAYAYSLFIGIYDDSVANLVPAVENESDGSFTITIVVGTHNCGTTADSMGVINCNVIEDDTTTIVTTDNTASTEVTLDKETVLTVFTEDELASEENLEVVLTVSEVTELTEDEQIVIDKLIATLDETYDISLILDIDLTKYVGETATSLTNLEQEIIITIDIPEDLQGKNLVIIRVHENEDGTLTADILYDIDDDATTFTFKTDKFSIYALSEVAESEIEDTPSGDEETEDTSSGDEETDVPQTGDTSTNVLVVTMITSFLGVVYISRKRLVK